MVGKREPPPLAAEVLGAGPTVSNGESPLTSAAGSAATTVPRGPRRRPRRCGRSGVNLLTDSPGRSEDARGRSRLHRARVIAERCSRLPGPARGSVQPKGSPPPGFSFQNNHGGGSINPIVQRGKQRRGETVPDGKWFWPAWDSDTQGLRPFWHQHSRVEPELRAAGREAGWGRGLAEGGSRPVAGKQNRGCPRPGDLASFMQTPGPSPLTLTPRSRRG